MHLTSSCQLRTWQRTINLHEHQDSTILLQKCKVTKTKVRLVSTDVTVSTNTHSYIINLQYLLEVTLLVQFDL